MNLEYDEFGTSQTTRTETRKNRHSIRIVTNELESPREEVKGIIQRGDELEWVDESRTFLKLPHETLMVFIHRKGVAK